MKTERELTDAELFLISGGDIAGAARDLGNLVTAVVGSALADSAHNVATEAGMPKF